MNPFYECCDLQLVDAGIRLGENPLDHLLQAQPRGAFFSSRGGGSSEWSLGQLVWPPQSALGALTSQSRSLHWDASCPCRGLGVVQRRAAGWSQRAGGGPCKMSPLATPSCSGGFRRMELSTTRGKDRVSRPPARKSENQEAIWTPVETRKARDRKGFWGNIGHCR